MEHIYANVSARLSTDSYNTLIFQNRFDTATTAPGKIVDMPDNRARIVVKFLLQNKGRLLSEERARFSELTDAEVRHVEKRIRAILPVDF